MGVVTQVDLVLDVSSCEVRRVKEGMRMKRGVIPNYETSMRGGQTPQPECFLS